MQDDEIAKPPPSGDWDGGSEMSFSGDNSDLKPSPPHKQYNFTLSPASVRIGGAR
jgi:hypothetical protein